jgi:hypothetical protein
MRFGAGRRFSLLLVAGILAIGASCAKAPDDRQLTAQIQSKLSEDSGLHGKPVTVETSGGVVTLSGTVENETQRTAAARYAAAIPGIKEVVNNLVITPAPATRAANEMAPAPPPAPEKPSGKLPSVKTASVKTGPNTPSDPTGQNSGEMAATAPPAAVADNRVPEEIPAPSTGAALPDAPAPQATPAPAAKTVTVSSGTAVAIRLVDAIDSEKAQPGQTFRATLDSPLQSDSDAAVPAGYDVQGHIVDVKSAGKFAGQSLLVLQLDTISIGGQSYGIDTDPYRRQGTNRATGTAQKVGAGAVLGAIIGGMAGGGKGAGIGAAAGGGIGGGAQAASKSQPIQLPSETVLNFTLRSPLTVTLVDQGPDGGRKRLNPPQ